MRELSQLSERGLEVDRLLRSLVDELVHDRARAAQILTPTGEDGAVRSLEADFE